MQFFGLPSCPVTSFRSEDARKPRSSERPALYLQHIQIPGGGGGHVRDFHPIPSFSTRNACPLCWLQTGSRIGYKIQCISYIFQSCYIAKKNFCVPRRIVQLNYKYTAFLRDVKSFSVILVQKQEKGNPVLKKKKIVQKALRFEIE